MAGAMGPVVGEIIAVATTTFTAQSYALNEAPPFGSLLRVAVPRAASRRLDDHDRYDGEGGGRLEAGAPSGYDESEGRLEAGAPSGYDGGAGRLEAGGPRGYGIAAYYALCYASQTGSIEPGRHAVAWGRFEDDEEDVYRRQPQLAQVLRTTFDALLVGYEPAAIDGWGADPALSWRDRDTRAATNGHASGGASRVALGDLVMDVAPTPATPVQRVPATPPRLHAPVRAATPEETARFNGSLAYLRFVLRAGLPLADDVIAAAILHAYEATGRDDGFLLEAARGVARLLGAEHERVMDILELLDAHDG